MLTEDDREGHVPSPAPGDTPPSAAAALTSGGGGGLHSPQRKLSVIPEVPGFSRPPSLAELAVAKQKNGDLGSLEIVVSRAKARMCQGLYLIDRYIKGTNM